MPQLNIIIYQILITMLCSSFSIKKDCPLFIESMNNKDTLIITNTTYYHGREIDVEKMTIFYQSNELVAHLNREYTLTNEVLCDTILTLSHFQIDKIKLFEDVIRNKVLEGNQINLSGYLSHYELVIKNKRVEYSTTETYYRFCNENLF